MMHDVNSTGNATSPIEAPAALGRRSFLAAAATAAAAAMGSDLLARDYGPHAAPVRYPDPDIIVLDKRFAKYKIGNTPIQRLFTGCLWAEGPAWNGGGNYLVWSDIPNDRQLRWLDEDGHVSVIRKPAGNSNGNTFDYEGRQLSCEHGNRRVVRYENTGKVTVLASEFQGKPLNAPNDVIVHPDGGIWFTDPGYGSLMDYEGHKGKLELKEAVYRIDSKTKKIEKVTDEIFKPNGLCFSPDYKKLYVADTGASHYEEAPKNIKVWDVVDGVKLGKGKEFVSMKMMMPEPGAVVGELMKLSAKNAKADPNAKAQPIEAAGMADGIRADTDGNIWASAGWVGEGYDGVHIFAPDGTRIGQILLPEICSNVCFGGPKRNRLFMTGSQSLYAAYFEAQGAHIT
jgi:gluconolactonase